jgi:hypothetical protein
MANRGDFEPEWEEEVSISRYKLRIQHSRLSQQARGGRLLRHSLIRIIEHRVVKRVGA